MQIQTARDVAAKIEQDPQFEAAVKANPAEAIRAVAEPLPNTMVYQIVVGSLGLVVILTIGGGIYLAAIGKSLPDGIVALAAAGVGALAGLLAPSPTR